MEIRFYVMVFGDESGLIESPILGIIYTSLLKQGLLILSWWSLLNDHTFMKVHWWFLVREEFLLADNVATIDISVWQVHSRGKALAKDVDFEKIARRTPGFTGADLQNLMNEAAILAARRDLKEISKDEISDALERIIAGPEKKNAVVSDEKKKLVAYHGT